MSDFVQNSVTLTGEQKYLDDFVKMYRDNFSFEVIKPQPTEYHTVVDELGGDALELSIDLSQLWEMSVKNSDHPADAHEYECIKNAILSNVQMIYKGKELHNLMRENLQRIGATTLADWRWRYWGSPESCSDVYWEIGAGYVRVSFDTLFQEPQPIFIHLGRQHPELTLNIVTHRPHDSTRTRYSIQGDEMGNPIVDSIASFFK